MVWRRMSLRRLLLVSGWRRTLVDEATARRRAAAAADPGRWRVGGSESTEGCTIYQGNRFVGSVRRPEDAADLVEWANLVRTGRVEAYDPGRALLPTMAEEVRAAEFFRSGIVQPPMIEASRAEEFAGPGAIPVDVRGLVEFRVTFQPGQSMDSEGWLTILAPDETAARNLLYARFGGDWVAISRADVYLETQWLEWCTLGEMARWVTLRPTQVGS